MQQTQQNCALMALICLGLLATSGAGLASNGVPSDLLLSKTKGPCDPKLDAPDYVAGTDVNGNPVASADLSRPKVPLPGELWVPKAGQGGTNSSTNRAQALVGLDQNEMDSILNPAPACPPERKAR
jgi:hypothetical protein